MAGNEAGNPKLVFFGFLITFLFFVLLVIFPIFVLTVLRDGSSSDICDNLRQSLKNESLLFKHMCLRNCPDCPASDCPKPKPSTFDLREVYERLDALDGMYNHWPDCQCRPSKLSPDGYGNCNFGQAKGSNRPWCYISQHGKLRVCPDQTPSESYPGFYWSNFACITPLETRIYGICINNLPSNIKLTKLLMPNVYL